MHKTFQCIAGLGFSLLTRLVTVKSAGFCLSYNSLQQARLFVTAPFDQSKDNKMLVTLSNTKDSWEDNLSVDITSYMNKITRKNNTFN